MRPSADSPVATGGKRAAAAIEPRSLTPPPQGTGRFLFDVVRTCRPQQWVKNSFVLAPLFFSQSLAAPAALAAACAACACFCLWSSSVYCLNDVLDAPADRRHPRKRFRPVAAGRVSPAAAVALAVALIAAGAALSRALLPWAFLLCGGLYLANSVAYFAVFKRHVIADVLSIAIGFVLRLLAGCLAIGVKPSSWLLVCGFSLAMLLGFGKRRLEIEVLEEPVAYRPTHESYSVTNLNLLLGIAASICLLTYMLYTVAPETVQRHHTDKLIYTVPFVAYGIFRYLFKVQEGRHDGPVEVLLKDRTFLLNGLLWLASVAAALYFGDLFPFSEP